MSPDQEKPLISQQAAVDTAANMGANFFMQRRWIRAIAKPFLEKNRAWGHREPLEDDAVAAVMAHIYADADLESMAAHMPTLVLTLEEELVIGRAAIRLCRNPQFSKQLFDGDAGPMILEEIEKARAMYMRGSTPPTES